MTLDKHFAGIAASSYLLTLVAAALCQARIHGSYDALMSFYRYIIPKSTQTTSSFLSGFVDTILGCISIANSSKITIQANRACPTTKSIVAMDDKTTDYVLSLDMHQVRSQLTLRSLPHTGRSDYDLRQLLAVHYLNDIKDGWSLDSDRHMLLKPANEDSGVAQETLSVVGRRLGYLIPSDEHYAYARGLSGSKDLPILLRPDHAHVDNSLGMDVELQDNLADTTNNHIGGPLVRSARTLFCRPHGGNARLVFGLQLEDMDQMGLIYCQLGRDVQGPELRLSGDVAMYPRTSLQWPEEDECLY